MTTPFFSYDQDEPVAPNETCSNGSSAISGLAFYPGGPFPASYDNALFFSDYARDCLWVIFAGSDGLPDPSTIIPFVQPAANPVDVQVSPGGDLFYVDLNGGTVRRIQHLSSNGPPVAMAEASPTFGALPLTVMFDGSGSTDPDAGDTLSYAWDLDGDGQFDDAFTADATRTYTQAGTVTVRLRVTDDDGASSTATISVSPGNTPPTATITSPTPGVRWKVGDSIEFGGSASDQQSGALPASALTWQLIMHHCPSTCHEHPIQQYFGVAGGSFVAPDHDYPSHLELKLTATDPGGLTNTTVGSDRPTYIEPELRFGSERAHGGRRDAATDNAVHADGDHRVRDPGQHSVAPDRGWNDLQLRIVVRRRCAEPSRCSDG